MKTSKNIFIAFILNLSFSIFELIGGIFSNSVAILSDSVHDLGDAISIGVSYFLEKKSHKKPDEKYTYGYIRYSVIGSLITTTILLVGSILVAYHSIGRIINPVEVNYDGMIIFAVIGVIVNFIATMYTKDGDSLNQRSVNLHMLEDVLGWIVVFIGSIIMKFTDIKVIDPILSIGVSIFIFIHALKNMGEIINIFLEKTPKSVNINEIKEHLLNIKGVKDVHHIHVWSIDGYNNYATMHVVYDKNEKDIKNEVKNELKEHGINHITVELETEEENCNEEECKLEENDEKNHPHHPHHH